jgi:DNA (cytosine-5)-methyltransferase 1
MGKVRYGSVCSGIEAATMAWHVLGWTPAFFAEIEPFPCAVLAHHYGSNLPGEEPASNGVPNYGDMTRFEEWPDAAIELLVGGTPCQSFSIAGLRAGLADPRGNLMLTYLAVAAKYSPSWVVWENVPGVLSSNAGRDFGTFLRGLVELGYGFAYRVLDAQYVRVGGFERAVPQRRRRVFVVGYRGDWRRAAAVLFDGAILRGDSAPRREARQEVTGTLGSRSTGGGGLGTDFEIDGGLIYAPTISPALKARDAKGPSSDGDGDGAPLLAVAHYTANIRAASGGSSRSDVQESWAVRRLTPRECERLQGFPDDFTAIPYRGKPAADGPRYKALGNSMAVNCMRWIGERIALIDQMEASA